jgi:FkbH-like protein
MKLNEALSALAQARGRPVAAVAFLVCGFEPLHLPTLLSAHYLQRFPDQTLRVIAGLYGDLEGNLERAAQSSATLAFVVLEWSDLDARLGLRAAGAWSGPAEQEILSGVSSRLERIRDAVRRLALRMPVVLTPPSVPFRLPGHTHGAMLSAFELELELALGQGLAALVREPQLRLLHPEWLAARSPSGARQDARSELATGFPFRVEHASLLAQGCIQLGFPEPPKKGLITDLDDTFWSGLVGEIGAAAVSWSQAEHGQLHGLYQLTLRQLHDQGALLGVASKNEPAVVEAALQRKDLWLAGSTLFPVRAGWGPKSASVRQILEAWNIAADAVVVVDDSRMELEEIQRAHPCITCLEFAPKDPNKTLALLEQLRDLFGKPVIVAEDRLRAESVRSLAAFEEERAGQDLEGFLRSLAGKVRFDARKDRDNPRLASLIDKTNQFNLNGLRVGGGEWLRLLEREDSFAIGVSYSDRYGPLGTIGVMAGSLGAEGALVEHWVLSCRAFSRRVEHHMLRYLFELAGQAAVQLSFRRTERNQPLCEFLAGLGLDVGTDARLSVPRSVLEQGLGALPHEAADVYAAGAPDD